MILLTPQQCAVLSEVVASEGPGPMVASHVIQTGNGSVWVDHWPDPRAIMAEIAGNYSLNIATPRSHASITAGTDDAHRPCGSEYF